MQLKKKIMVKNFLEIIKDTFVYDCMLYQGDDKFYHRLGTQMWIIIAICVTLIIYYDLYLI